MDVKALFTWSGGKDSALALYEMRQAGAFDVLALLTTVTREYQRVSMHGVRRTLLRQQAAALGYPLAEVFIPSGGSNAEYELEMRERLLGFRDVGVRLVAFGDICLDDVRRRREEHVATVGLRAVFPLWGRSTTSLARRFTELGFKAVVTCVDTTVLGSEFVGREFDRQFLSDLPATVDPCGENGEFHSFVYDGPIFRRPVSYVRGEAVCRDNRFVFCDLMSGPDVSK
jgi:uncharacterized protein (TIGR00290 family)